MAEHKEWLVDLVVTSEHQYTVLARTQEEAVSIAEGLYDDGNEGFVTGVNVESADAMSGDITSSIEDELEEEDIEFES